jgi:hypothetical protein
MEGIPMTDVDQAVQSQESESRRAPALGDVGIVVAATLVALGGWLVWHVAGVDLVVRSGDDVREVGAGAVGITALLASLAGVGLIRLLAKRATGLRTWTILAVVVCAVSMLGPLGASTLSAGLSLASLHLMVGATVVFGVRRVHCGPA